MKMNFRCYSRLLVDNHITDLKPEFMSQYSVEEYVRMVQLAGVESAMVYACDHNGNCYYPTKIGHIHANITGDIFGDAVRLLREKNIVPVAYYTVIYHNDCAKRFPQARIIDNVGADHDGRYHFTCPNQPEAEAFFREQLREILQYPVEGLFIDMTFWPSVCCCDACRKAFGEPFPAKIDWNDPKWVRFQRFRERSIASFAQRLTDFAKSVKPGISVAHQFSPVLHGWYLGQSSGIADASDYASGDFYGSKLQQRFAVKAFDAYTKNPPFEFMTSRCVDLHDHTSGKSDEELFLSALTTLASGGAYFFIDAINPNGTLEEPFYKRLGKINRELAPFRNEVGHFSGRLSAETGLYFSMISCMDSKLNGRKFMEYDGGRANNLEARKNAVLDECLGSAEILNRLHIPWKILTDRSKDFTGLKSIILDHAAYLTEEECERLRHFVFRKGGTLIATGISSLYDSDGNTSGNFALSDVFGIDFTGKYSDSVTYTGEELVSAEGNLPLVQVHSETEVISFLTFPDFPVFDPVHYASIHSNPPSSEPSPYPAVTLHRYGKGRVLWLAAPVTLKLHHTQIEFMKKIYREFLPGLVTSSENLPESAEITVLKNDQDLLLCIVNQQDEFPVIPLSDIKLSIRMPNKPKKIIRISDQSDQSFDWENGILSFGIEKLHYGDFFKIRGVIKKENDDEQFRKNQKKF